MQYVIVVNLDGVEEPVTRIVIEAQGKAGNLQFLEAIGIFNRLDGRPLHVTVYERSKLPSSPAEECSDGATTHLSEESMPTNEAPKRLVRLTNRPPVWIVTADWPVVSGVETWEGEHKSQAFRRWEVDVMQHADGRTLIAGVYHTNFPQDWSKPYAGYLEPAGTTPESLCETIRTVCNAIGAPELADECIGGLPAVDL